MAVTYPLRIGPNGRHLVDYTGTKFLVQMDAAWSMGVQLTAANTETYLEDRRIRKFNGVLVNAVEHKFSSQTPKWRNANGVDPFSTSEDFSTPNTSTYWTQLDAQIALAGTKGICVFLVPCYLGFTSTDEGWYDAMVTNGAAKMRAYGRFIGDRYKSFDNIVWVLGGDRIPANKELLRQVFLGIRETDTIKPKIAMAHTDPENNTRTAYPADLYTLANFYTYSTELYQAALAEYAKALVRPFILIESKYEGESGWSLLRLRRQAYQTMCCGGAGQCWGNNPIWLFGTGWEGSSGISSTGSQHQTHWWNVFAGRSWEKLVPDTGHTFITSGFGTDGATSYGTAALTRDGSLGMCYVSGALSPVAAMTKMRGSTTARWWDPTNGTFTTVSGSPFAATGSRTYTHPGNNAGGDPDWLLVLEA